MYDNMCEVLPTKEDQQNFSIQVSLGATHLGVEHS